jgi:microcystin degradation protein MlrC
MADPADNAGGGAPSDNTTILRRLIERDVPDAAVGPIWDPIAVRLCFDAGAGASFHCGSAARSARPPACQSTPR